MKGSIIWRSGKAKKAGGIGTHITAITKRRFMPNLQRVKALVDGQGVDAGLMLLGAIWSGVFVLFPLFNRDRLRLGDLAAGTMVVKAPKRTWKKPEAKTKG